MKPPLKIFTFDPIGIAFDLLTLKMLALHKFTSGK